jgi:hypothetical protein
MAMLKDLSALAPFSLLADCAHVLGMLVVLKDDFDHYRLKHETLIYNKGFAALPFLFGVFIYCYEGISMILPVEDSMADKSKVCLVGPIIHAKVLMCGSCLDIPCGSALPLRFGASGMRGATASGTLLPWINCLHRTEHGSIHSQGP